tara:strand:+ start:4577 stop:5350 length:774 start_codon:yes stop_codon:yes gene_type:complete
MPTLNLTAFTDGVASDPATVEGNFYTPSSTGQGSLEIINGHLGPINMPSLGGGNLIGKEQIQQGALSNGKAIGGNTNLDYFGDGFLGWDIATENASAVEADKFYKTIPGASMTFFLPYSPSLLVLSWGIFVAAKVDKYDPTASDGSELASGGPAAPDPYFASNYGAIIRAYLDGSRIDRKYFPVPPKDLTSSIGYGNWDRTWSSFYFVQFPSAGWHNVTLRTIVPPVTVIGGGGTNYERPNNQLRVRTRHMDYVYFR